MLYGLIQLTWFEATTAALPFITVALLQLLNALLTDQTTRRVNSANELTTAVNLLAEDGTAATTTAANGKSTAANGAENGKLQKQKSEHSDDVCAIKLISHLSANVMEIFICMNNF
uniref:Uncharacterized protein n=1 Tax=Bactrocera latifrons TaxID=174628 RepID=A0A0K8ULF7_BACLA